MAAADPDVQRLFDAFRSEVWAERTWDSEFTPSPHDPGRAMRELVDGAGAAAVPALLGALGDAQLRYWAVIGLGWLGPEAGADAADALAARVEARQEPLWAAAVALDAVATARARSLGVQHWPETMEHLTDRYLKRGDDATTDYVEWFTSAHGDEHVVPFLGQRRLRDRIWHDCPPRLAGVLRGLSGRGPGVRRAAAELLAGFDTVTEELVDALSHGPPLWPGVVERVAAHPASERLVPRLVEVPGSADALAELITRRRCAGLATDPAPVRDHLRRCVAEPTRRWPFPRYGDAPAVAVADLRDPALLRYLEPMLTERLGPPERTALVRAFASFGAEYRTLLGRDADMLSDVERYRPRVEQADETFLGGRIESTLGGAFTAYGNVLLLEPSARAAFQLAWIDRAYGAPVTAARIDWIRGLGLADEALLAELGRPVARPLDGLRFQWDPGESRTHDPARAARIAAAGLPSLAARWYRSEAYDHAAREHVRRVAQAA
ncbi:hypothetical protein ABZS66_24005 [Dactylosporangium sp. NPDC005572]|uniref:hypothetical protein n=1 Tax=Dactylosporangium sp. NPDC005572 TaxID=3156889 RepID=UPI0033A0CAD2